MGKKEELLRKILGATKGEKIKVEDAFVNQASIKEIYISLKGCSVKIPKRIGNFDIKINDNYYIELDEQLHFNRYRLITLNSPIYNTSKLFNVERYKQYCKQHETDCLKAGGFGGKWKNNSTEKLFPKSSPKKDLEGNGSSRWRQRAFYDFLKDFYAIKNNIVLRRISIWDKLSTGILVKDVLDSEMESHYNELTEHIMNKFN